MFKALMDAIPNVLLGASLVGLGVFAFTYGRYADWRKTKPGRALMYMIVSMALVLAMAFAHLITGNYPGIEFVRYAVYGLFTFSVWNMVRALYQQIPIDPLYFLRVGKRTKVKEREPHV